MIECLLPASVTAVEAFSDVDGETVFPGEEHLIGKAVESRRREFVTTRRCAREALRRLGRPPAPILAGPKREPVWPYGVIGSLTHCVGYRAAAVAEAGILDSIGIDAEPHGPLPDGVEDAVTLPAERDMLACLGHTHGAAHWGKVLFSAKESVYKAWYPLTGRWLGFDDARLTIDPSAGTFRAELLVPGTRLDDRPPLTVLRGRFVVTAGLVVTAVTVPAPGDARLR
jgi:4'-phosphopantetheinyl transferase EntD